MRRRRGSRVSGKAAPSLCSHHCVPQVARRRASARRVCAACDGVLVLRQQCVRSAQCVDVRRCAHGAVANRAFVFIPRRPCSSKISPRGVRYSCRSPGKHPCGCGISLGCAALCFGKQLPHRAPSPRHDAEHTPSIVIHPSSQGGVTAALPASARKRDTSHGPRPRLLRDDGGRRRRPGLREL